MLQPRGVGHGLPSRPVSPSLPEDQRPNPTEADQPGFFQGGAAFRRGPLQIQRTLDGELFRSGREGQFVYRIPLSPGTYELHLYFAEAGVDLTFVPVVRIK